MSSFQYYCVLNGIDPFGTEGRYGSEQDARGGGGGKKTVGKSQARYQFIPLVALLADDVLLDSEADSAAGLGLDVLRFSFVYEPELREAPTSTPVRAVFRGFMLSLTRYTQLYHCMAKLGVYLLTSPLQYEAAHYYPNAYPFLKEFSPKAHWVPVDRPEEIGAEAFADALLIVRGWNARSVALKDYVKSAKHKSPHLLCVDVDDDLPAAAVELVRARAGRFNRGVVFKEYVPTRVYDKPRRF